MFLAEIRKIMYTPVNPSFTIEKWGLRGTKLYRRVFVMLTTSIKVICSKSLQSRFNRRQTDDIFLIFPKKGFDISCKLSTKEIICMKCQRLFFLEKAFKISSAELPRMLSVQ